MDWENVYPDIQDLDDFQGKRFEDFPGWKHGKVFTACITPNRYSSLKPCVGWAEREARRYVFYGPRGIEDFAYIASIERESLDHLYAASRLKLEQRDTFIKQYYAYTAPDEFSAIILWVNDTQRQYISNRIPLFPMREYERLINADEHCVIVAMGGLRLYKPPPK